jgi:hypothetical protein
MRAHAHRYKRLDNEGVSRLYPNAKFPHPESMTGVPLPPGQYPYSPALPQIMNALTPTYVIPAEPVFMDHLLMHVEKNIRVKTVEGTLVGKLAGVAVDHIQINVEGVPHHVRLHHIIYFAKV